MIVHTNRTNFIIADGIYLTLAGTMFVQSSGVPRVGLRASRAMDGAPLKAAAGRATAVKLQIIESATV